MKRFRDRRQAGEALAAELADLRGDDCVVLALPRGGVPVGYEIARALGAPLEPFLVRKLGVPHHEELAFGAIASGGLRVYNDEVLRTSGITEEEIEQVALREERELHRREEAYGTGEPPVLEGRTAILVDDGIATGATMRVALDASRPAVEALVLAVPVAPPQVRALFESRADRYVVLREPKDMRAIGLWYDDFSQTSDAEVCALLERRG